MLHATLNSQQTKFDLARLDSLIALVDGPGRRNLETPEPEIFDILSEHLHSARVYLLGAMPMEYAESLEKAWQVAGRVHDRELRSGFQDAIHHLLNDAGDAGFIRPESERLTHTRPAGKTPDGAQSPLWNFFSSADSAFGSFYPNRHIIVVFPTLADAHSAQAALASVGFSTDEMRTASAADMLTFLDELHAYSGLWGAIMTRLSRMFATEEIFSDKDIRSAHHGAGFLAVYNPDEAEAERIRDLILPFHPAAMQRYQPGGIVSLI